MACATMADCPAPPAQPGAVVVAKAQWIWPIHFACKAPRGRFISTESTDCSSADSTPRPKSDRSSLPSGLSLGACPTAAFPNNHLKVPCSARWAAPRNQNPVDSLREAVADADWDGLHAEGRTMQCADRTWAASEERGEALRALCALSGARRALEVGAFVGVSSLSMAEALPEGGQVVSLEVDPFLAHFGRRAGLSLGKTCHRVRQVVGPAGESLRALAAAASKGEEPFGFVLLDADAAGAKGYFELLWGSPGLLSKEATVCVGLGSSAPPAARLGRPVRGRAPAAGELEALRAAVQESPDFDSYELCGLLVVKKSTRHA